MNTIYLRQNRELALECQTSARYYYNKADLLDNFYWGGTILTIICKLLWVNNIGIDYLLIFWFFITLVLDTKISNYTSNASEFKQVFDEYVFGWKEEISQETRKQIKALKSKNEKMFKRQTHHTGNDNPRGVKNWYEFVDNEIDQKNAINDAIKESVYYDKNINSTLLIIVIIAALVSLFYFRDETLNEYLTTIFLVMSSLSKKVITTFLKTLRTNRLNNEINLRLKLATTEEDYKEIQNIIFIKRQISGVTPSWVYYIKKKRITKFAASLFSK